MSLKNNVLSLASTVYCRRQKSYSEAHHNHAAVFFHHGDPLSPLSYGENHYMISLNKTLHAEENAIRKLPSRPKQKKPERLDLIVIRANKLTFGNSKPCIHCILKLQDLPSRGYVLNKVYFSNECGEIVSCRLEDLVNDPNPHTSRFYKGHGFFLK
jgi:cytidine deaminase